MWQTPSEQTPSRSIKAILSRHEVYNADLSVYERVVRNLLCGDGPKIRRPDGMASSCRHVLLKREWTSGEEDYYLVSMCSAENLST